MLDEMLVLSKQRVYFVRCDFFDVKNVPDFGLPSQGSVVVAFRRPHRLTGNTVLTQTHSGIRSIEIGASRCLDLSGRGGLPTQSWALYEKGLIGAWPHFLAFLQPLCGPFVDWVRDCGVCVCRFGVTYPG